MTFKHDGYYADGSLVVYGYDDYKSKVAIFRGFVDYRRNVVTLYPKVCFIPTKENIGKLKISISELSRQTRLHTI